MASNERGSLESYPSPRQNPLPFYHVNDERNTLGTASREGAPARDDGQAAHGRPSLEDPETQTQFADAVDRMNGHNDHAALEGMQHVWNLNESATSAPPPLPATHARTSEQPETGPSTPPGKQKDRIKVSRACDACRKKKIRCDATDESGSTSCTNCTRNSVRCEFTRQPLKRGPSKGYIKDLAARLISLERQVQPSHLQPQTQAEIQNLQRALVEANGGDASSAAPSPRVGDKRSRDVAEGMQHTFNSMQSAVQVSGPPDYPYNRPQSQSGTYQRSGEAQPFWSRNAQENRREILGTSAEIENVDMSANFDWDENVVSEYYRIIHQTFPLLPNNKTRLRQRLAECPVSLREAFVAALDCLMRTFPTTTLQPNPNYAQVLKRTAELLARYPFENPSSHTNATNLVYLQTLLLMALESDNHGPATIRGQAGPSRAEWLGRAAGVAGQLEINVIHTSGQSVISGDPDSEERLARRVWWVLFILDRWHASSTADLLKLPENSVVLLPEDQILLGESTYHLARLSFIIGHLAAILTTTKTPSTDVMARSNPASSLLVLTLAGEIDRFRESVESVWGSLNLVHLSYHHCHLLIKRLSPDCAPTELVGHAVKVATVLNSRLTPVTPLNHHFGALAAMTLCELCDVPQTRSEAVKGIDSMIQALGEGRGLAGKLDSDGWDGAVRELVVKKKDRLLQTAADVTNNNEFRFDPTMLTRYGYLTALGQGLFRSK